MPTLFEGKWLVRWGLGDYAGAMGLTAVVSGQWLVVRGQGRTKATARDLLCALDRYAIEDAKEQKGGPIRHA
jgi:hypothetical protein